MNTFHRRVLTACWIGLMPFGLYAEAPVVDDSENYALLDGQEAPYHQPSARSAYDESYNEDERPLAHESVEASSTQSNAQLLNKLNGLQQEIQELRGQLDVQAHDLKALQEQQLAFYKDLDARLGATVKTPPHRGAIDIGTPPVKPSAATPPSTPLPVMTPVSTTPRGNPADEQISYLAAYELVKAKHYEDAIAAMQAFVTQYPQGGYTANATYWLGELYLATTDYSNAISHFQMVLQQFPSSSKAAPSMLKMGYALAASGKKQEAVAQLKQVVKQYPDTSTAQLAMLKLQSLQA